VRHVVGTIVVVLALVVVAGANSAATDFNVDGAQISAVEGIRFSDVVATFTDPLTGANTYKATIDWGDGTTDAGTVTYTGEKKSDHRVYNVTGSHTWAKGGTYTLLVKVEGPGGQGTSKPTALVTGAAISVAVAVPAVVEGGTVNAAIATITQSSGAPASSFSATINWGDGATSAGAIATTGTTTLGVGGTHTYGEEGQVTVTVTATSAGGSTATASQLVTIGDAPLTAGAPAALRGVEGRAVPAVVVAKFTDGNAAAPASDFTATINWGDGQSGPGTVSAAPGGGFQVTGGPHTYRDQGRFQTMVAVKDKGGASVNVPGTATIGDAPIRPKGMRIDAHIGKPFRGTVATFVDANPKAPLSDYTVRINWGDGRTTFGKARRTRSGLVATGQHTWGGPGLKKMTITIIDEGGSRATATSRARVT
jgi:large repetitive protein